MSQATDTTRQAQIVECPDVIYVDLPGYDTSQFPENAFFSTFNPLQYDLFLCVFAGKLHQADVDFFGKIARTGRVCLFVRNKCDGLYDPSCSREELERKITADVHSLVGPREKWCSPAAAGTSRLRNGVFLSWRRPWGPCCPRPSAAGSSAMPKPIRNRPCS